MTQKEMKRFGALTGVLVWLCCALAANAVAASGAGRVMNLSGTLSATGADGKLRVLSINSEVQPGDTLYTTKGTYARVKFTDGGEITLRPDTHLKIESYHHDAAQPTKDNAVFSLLKGGLRALSGLIGHRGDPDAYAMKTPAATIGIRGTNYGALFCQNDCAGIPTASGKPPENGLHVDVAQGAVVVKNPAGTQLFSAGQFGFVKEAQVQPVMVPPEQGVKATAPPSVTSDNSKPSGNTVGKNGSDECAIK
jgi:hypothetical protein